ncbi:PKD/REJ-like domain-containing protein [Plasmodiophora brassicae]
MRSAWVLLAVATLLAARLDAFIAGVTVQQILDLMNSARANVVPTAAKMVKLQWNATLASAAASYAATQCSGAFSGTGPTCANCVTWIADAELPSYGSQGILDVIAGNFIAGKSQWPCTQTGSTLTCSCPKTPCFNDWTTLVNDAATAVGCGEQTSTACGGQSNIYVCAFNGWTSNAHPYTPSVTNSSCTMSTCPSAYPVCVDGLCTARTTTTRRPTTTRPRGPFSSHVQTKTRRQTSRPQSSPGASSFWVRLQAPTVVDPSTSLALYATIASGTDRQSLRTSWTCDALDLSPASGNVLTSPTDTLSLVLAPNALQYATSYRFTITARLATSTSSASAMIVIPPRPTGGVVNVTWAGGPPVELSTVFNISTRGWQAAAAPLEFVFSYVVVGGASGTSEFSIGTAAPRSTSALTTLPSGDPVRVLVCAIAPGSRVRSAPVWTDIVVHRASTQQVLDSVLSSATTVVGPPQVVMNRLQLATLALNAVANYSTSANSSSAVVAARSALISTLVTACSNASNVNADSAAVLLGTLTAQPEQLSVNATQQVMAFAGTLVQQSLSSTTSLSLQGLTAVAQSVSSAMTAARLTNTTSSATSAVQHAVVDLIASAQVATTQPCRPASTISTANFRSHAWSLDGLAHANGTCAGTGAQQASVVLPPDFWSAMNVSGDVGVQMTIWADNPHTSARLVNGASPVTTVRTFRIRSPAAAAAEAATSSPEPIVVRSLSPGSPINVSLTPAAGAAAGLASLSSCPSTSLSPPVCVTFDSAGQNWTTAGCTTSIMPTSSGDSNATATVTCSCTHLTDFALVMYLEEAQRGPGCGGRPGRFVDQQALADVISNANAIHRVFLVLYICTACIALVLVTRARRHITKVHARRSVYVLLSLSIVACAARSAISAFNLSLDTPIVTLAVLSVLPSMCEFFLLTYFILMIWSIGDRIKKMSTSVPQNVLSGIARPYFIGNAVISLAVPALVVCGVVFAADDIDVAFVGVVPLPTFLFDAASALVAVVCLLCGVHFLYYSRAMLKMLVEAAATIVEHQRGQAASYRKVGRFVFTVCTLFSAALCLQSALWLLSIVSPTIYLAGFVLFYALFLAGDLACVLLVVAFCSRTVSIAAQASAAGSGSADRAPGRRVGHHQGGDAQISVHKPTGSGRPLTSLLPSYPANQSSRTIAIAVGPVSSGGDDPLVAAEASLARKAAPVDVAHRRNKGSRDNSDDYDDAVVAVDDALQATMEHALAHVGASWPIAPRH